MKKTKKNQYMIEFKTNLGAPLKWGVTAESEQEAKKKAIAEILKQLETIQVYKVTGVVKEEE